FVLVCKPTAWRNIGIGYRDMVTLMPISDLKSVSPDPDRKTVEAFHWGKESVTIRSLPCLNGSPDEEMIVKQLHLCAKRGLKSCGRGLDVHYRAWIDECSIIGHRSHAQEIGEVKPVDVPLGT